MNRLREFLATLPSLWLATCAALPVELDRRRCGPLGAVAAARGRGRRCRERSGVEVARLWRAVRWVDALFGANCYRRTLLIVSLDRGFALQEVSLGLRNSGGALVGHAWCEAVGTADDYEVVFRV